MPAEAHCRGIPQLVGRPGPTVPSPEEAAAGVRSFGCELCRIMKQLLYLTHSAGYRHEVLPFSQEVVTRLGAEAVAYHATCTDSAQTVDWNDLGRYDAIAFCTTGELPIEDAGRRNLIEFVRNGKAFMGIHNATDTFYTFEPYGQMIGGYFNGHPWHQEVQILVEDRNHPATR